MLKQNNKISVRYFPSATLACNCNISQHAVSRPRRHHHHQSGPFMSSSIYFLSHAHWLCLQHLSQLSALLRFFCFRNKILQLHFVAQNRRRQRSAQHVPHRALASFVPAASTCKIKQNAAALCSANMIATHCTNTSHSNRRTPYVRARRPQIPASDNSVQSARGSTAQCYFLCLLQVLVAWLQIRACHSTYFTCVLQVAPCKPPLPRTLQASELCCGGSCCIQLEKVNYRTIHQHCHIRSKVDLFTTDRFHDQCCWLVA